ncbi:MAG: hypothetical protein A2725_04240 [Candidatus Magasanikbacteria bacterium RIFCSPHIGHO2_01_FULL_33_34]|uniref:Prepilin-type N-terminal cleavage/methylation domain-containing protein n=1 Tax=Candidatus Magasanikbacteria bacterium RIFCSPHIGHO2_01_FULL_33_34 TaxID=1798671 RepID=A0A1F6LHL5_9BACT|nr:MAG: hypothetical protein A2725_04240 [Candidatus Magasanikbacteria bacterium RIFCSPHIGHO2_01_FULL_33_34]OGH65175.1 MAG: hypothetical protein A3B83_04000 [Candidatus Magasanikbacteria bacterium RIFCSPHIGHO2_02_FULL_33_17]OGH75280.1 MAG: hypothetical protein A3A89_04165 [Candidatus Magasanikbacteria bacterium RIFCSPLOWO2_01_FULL_33_34]OGH81035.1 MAG: hypothetical protein A3F93_00195 [Candidatus Magasanikbacteria bacterium RIFCSPLOWO2_12_FULL_34_7]
MNKKGFTLIEMLIYVAIIGGVVFTFVSFAISVVNSRNKTYTVSEVQANTRTALNVMTQKIRSSEAINTSTSIFGVDPGYLSLSMSSSTLNPTIISLDQDNGVLQIKEGVSASSTITIDKLNITNLQFTNLTDGDRENVRIDMTIEYGTANTEFNYSQSVQTAVTTRY